MALEDPINRAGVFGGTSPPERHQMVREHNITPEQAMGWYLSEQKVKLERIQAQE